MQKQAIRGFTLLELLISISIVGILATLALPAYHDYVKRTHVFEGIKIASAAKFSIYEYYYWNNQFPVDNAAADLPAPEFIQGNSLKSLHVENGIIKLTYNEKVEDNATILMVPSIAQGSLVWNCNQGTVNWNLRPKTCRTQ